MPTKKTLYLTDGFQAEIDLLFELYRNPKYKNPPDMKNPSDYRKHSESRLFRYLVQQEIRRAKEHLGIIKPKLPDMYTDNEDN